MDIKSLISTARPTKWVVYGDSGISFHLRYIPKALASKLMRESIIVKWDPKSHQRRDEPDGEKLIRSFMKEALIGWKGMTVRRLEQLVPLGEQTPDKLDLDIPYTEENAAELALTAYDLEVFIRDSSMDSSIFQPDREQVLGNSGTSQSGS